MALPQTEINKNMVTIRDFPPLASVTVTTNSPELQRVTVTSGGATILEFSGQGERTVIGATQVSGRSQIELTFEFQQDGAWLPSSLRSGGPFPIGTSYLLMLIGETGDDSDYNDVELQIKWKSA